MLSIAFGKRCPPFDTHETPIFFTALRLAGKVVAEAPPIDLVPILKYVPKRWASWKAGCKQVRTLQRRMYFGLLEEAETRLARGESTGCFMEDVIQRREELGMSRETAA